MSRSLRGGRFVRILAVGLMLVLALGLLAACGGPSGSGGDGGTTTAVGPEQRVKSFFDDMGAAFSDPDLAKPEAQEKHASTLAGYFKPADQERAKNEMQEGMGEASQTMVGAMAGLGAMTSGMDIRMTMKPQNVTTKLLEENDTTARVEITGGSFKIGFEGADAASLPPEVAAMTSQELPLTEMVSEMDMAEQNVITLEKVDGTWYFQTPEE